MEVRKAETRDIESLLRLLGQVNLIHHQGRPDLFRVGTKYTAAELEALLRDEDRPILVAEEGGAVKGYAFCVLQSHEGDNILTDIKTLYLDDLCVDESCRGEHVGSRLYGAVVELARSLGCYNVTLNVWQMNPNALRFYEAQGMKPLKTYMEQII